jgi:hypothetical protein
MFSTGKIGLWSVIEEGIGIFAGSLPALRPILTLPFFNRNPTTTGSNPTSAAKFKQSRSGQQVLRSDVRMDTFHQLPDKEGDGDGESQKYILKETQFTVMTNERSDTPGQWQKNQVLGWKKRDSSGNSG